MAFFEFNLYFLDKIVSVSHSVSIRCKTWILCEISALYNLTQVLELRVIAG